MVFGDMDNKVERERPSSVEVVYRARILQSHAQNSDFTATQLEQIRQAGLAVVIRPKE